MVEVDVISPPLTARSPDVVMLFESSIVTPEFCIDLPVDKLNLTIALSVEDAGPTTSPAPAPPPLAVDDMTTFPSDPDVIVTFAPAERKDILGLLIVDQFFPCQINCKEP